MYFLISDITVNPLFPPLIAFVVSFFCSMGGISGAFLLLPYQVSLLGITSPSVSATNHFFNVIATPSGLYRFFKEKRFLLPLTVIIAAGTVPGLFAGTFLRLTVFKEISSFKVFVGLVLLYIGGRMVLTMLRKKRTFPAKTSAKNKTVTVTEWNVKGFSFTYEGLTYHCESKKLILLSTVVGIIGGIYGVGGGAIIAPFLVASFNLPVHVIGGSTLFATFITSLGGSLLFWLLAPLYPDLQVSPDWALGALLGLGGIAGIYCGARCQKCVPELAIKIGLAILTICTGLRYLLAG